LLSRTSTETSASRRFTGIADRRRRGRHCHPSLCSRTDSIPPLTSYAPIPRAAEAVAGGKWNHELRKASLMAINNGGGTPIARRRERCARRGSPTVDAAGDARPEILRQLAQH